MNILIKNCVVACIDEYLRSSAHWPIHVVIPKVKINFLLHVLSHLKPYKEV